jgi:anti-sigma B factor antagonist
VICRSHCGNPSLDGFAVAATRVNDVVVVSVSGDLDMVTVPMAFEAIQLAGHAESAALIVDLTGVAFLSVAGITLLLDAHRQVASHRRFRVVASGSATSRPLKLLGIDAVVALYRTLDEALADLA